MIFSYQQLQIEELIQWIIEDHDLEALEELHTRRTPFLWRVDPPLRLAEYLERLRVSAQRKYGEIPSSLAYDLTMDKFFNSPRLHRDASKGDENASHTDCLNYYQACLKKMRQALAENPDLDPYDREMLAARVLQKFVLGHFYLSLKEALRRGSPFSSRYTWRVNGGALDLYFPRWINGRKRREWLEENMEDVDPHCLGERERIQSLINERLEQGRFESIENEGTLKDCWQAVAAHKATPANGPTRLALEIAAEKAERIDRLRPSIRNLGAARLKSLILKIFDGLEEGCYQASSLAEDYQLDEASFSRFAGSRWKDKKRNECKVPDLWANLAGVVAGRLEFREIALAAGVWQRIEHIAAGGGKEARRGA